MINEGHVLLRKIFVDLGVTPALYVSRSKTPYARKLIGKEAVPHAAAFLLPQHLQYPPALRINIVLMEGYASHLQPDV